MTDPQEKTPGNANTLTSILWIGMTIAVCLGLNDAARALSKNLVEFVDPTRLFLPLSVATIALGLVYCAAATVLTLLAFPWRSSLRLNPPLTAAGLLIAAFYLGLIESPTDAFLGGLPAVGERWLMILALGLGVGFGAAGMGSKLKAASVKIGLLAPLLALEFVLFYWFRKYDFDGLRNEYPAWPLIAIAVLGAATLAMGLRFTSIRALKTWNVVVALVVIASPILGAFMRPTPPKKIQNAQGIPGPRHVLLITVDTLRADGIGAYGTGKVPTPAVDRLSADGTTFMNAISPAPYTLPALASIHSGVDPSVHGVVRVSKKLGEEFTTLAERMSANGYKTAAIGTNDFLTAPLNLLQGFEDRELYPWRAANANFGLKLLGAFRPESYNPWATTSDLGKSAVLWINENHRSPFFLWVHFFDPHHPYVPSKAHFPANPPTARFSEGFGKGREAQRRLVLLSEAEKNWISDLYYAEVRDVDEQVGNILDALKDVGAYDDALIVFSSDHGEELWEHGGLGHGLTLHDEVLRVPYIIKPPGGKESRTFEPTVSTVTIMPTVLELCGIEFDAGGVSGASLAPLIASGIAPRLGPVFSTGLLQGFEERRSLYFSGMKYIEAVSSGREWLFDLKNDPAEQMSLDRLNVDDVRRARQLMKEHLDRAAQLRDRYRVSDASEAAPSEQATDALDALGYL